MRGVDIAVDTEYSTNPVISDKPLLIYGFR